MTAGRGTILVVDDDSVLRRLLATVLKLRGFEVLTAEDGNDAIQVIDSRRGRVDLVLADILMPMADGWDVLKAVRANYPQVPVIMLTILEEAKTTAKKAEAMGAAACLFKPIDPVTLMSSVDRVLGKSA